MKISTIIGTLISGIIGIICFTTVTGLTSELLGDNVTSNSTPVISQSKNMTPFTPPTWAILLFAILLLLLLIVWYISRRRKKS